MSDFKKLNSALEQRRAPRNGPISSSAYNATIDEIGHDLAELFHFVNRTIIPAFNGFGQPGTWPNVDAITNGIDGSTVMTDRDFADTSNPYFYIQTQSRPATVKESIDEVITRLNEIFNDLNQLKARLGTSDELAEGESTATLAELETRINYLNSLVRTLQTNTDSFLTPSGIANAIAVGDIDPATFNISDIDVITDAAINPTKTSGIDLTTNYSYVSGLPATYDLRDTVLRLKEFVEDTTGETFTSFANSGLSGDSLKTHRELVGTGTLSSTNPHGQDVGDLNDTNNLLSREVLIHTQDVPDAGSAPDPTYSYVNAAYTVTRIAGTVGTGGSNGMTVNVTRRRTGSNNNIETGFAVPASSPGSAVDTSLGGVTSVEAGDLIFVTVTAGDATEGRIQVWGTPES